MTDKRTYWIWVFGEIGRLRQVLESGLMPFSGLALSRVRAMKPGDRAILYLTRQAFGNPTRDRARLAGIAKVGSRVREGETLVLSGKEYGHFVEFEVEKLLPERTGPEVHEFVPQLEHVKVKDEKVWGVYFRNPPIVVSRHDFDLLAGAIRNWTPEMQWLREFDGYVTPPRTKLLRVRAEALVAGFRRATTAEDFETIVDIAEKVPRGVLEQSEEALRLYRQAQKRMGEV